MAIYVSCEMITGIYEVATLPSDVFRFMKIKIPFQREEENVRRFRDLCIFQLFNVTFQTVTCITVAVLYDRACLIGFVLLHFVLVMQCNVIFLIIVQWFYRKMCEEKYKNIDDLSLEN
jgi:hypothetical protein